MPVCHRSCLSVADHDFVTDHDLSPIMCHSIQSHRLVFGQKDCGYRCKGRWRRKQACSARTIPSRQGSGMNGSPARGMVFARLLGPLRPLQHFCMAGQRKSDTGPGCSGLLTSAEPVLQGRVHDQFRSCSTEIVQLRSYVYRNGMF
jgi:hypothetical protein